MAKKMIDPLRAYRKQHNLTQEELAQKLRVSRQLVAKLELGGTYTTHIALAIERRLGIDRDVIWERMAA